MRMWGKPVLVVLALAVCGTTSAAEPAEALAEAAKVRAGLCVHVGTGDGALTAGLARAGNFLVHGLALEDGPLAAARKHLRAAGLYGRATVERLPLTPLPYPSNLVNLLVVDDFAEASRRGLSAAEIRRVLVPNGAAVMRGADGLKGATAATTLSGWTVLRKPRPDGMAGWTHQSGDASGSRVSRDRLVGPPRRLKWIDAPRMYLSHFSHPPGWVSGNGRVYYAYDERHPRMAGPVRLNLVARDAYNGTVLWRQPAPIPKALRRGQPVFLGGAMVVHGDRLIAPMGENRGLVALDGGTGKVLLDYKAWTARVLLCDDTLLLQGNVLRAVDPETAAPRWTQSTPYCKRIVAGGGRVYAYFRRRTRRRPRKDEWGVGAFDRATGKPLWWAAPGERLFSYHRERLVLLRRTAPHFVGKRPLTVLAAETGKPLWSTQIPSRYVFPIDGTVWHTAGWTDASGAARLGSRGLDLGTGRETRRLSGYVPGSITHHWTRCSGLNATVRHLITGNTMDFLEVETDTHRRSMAARSSCHAGVQTANGMVYTFPVDCGCFKSLRGVLGLSPEEPAARAKGARRRVTGPAFGTVPSPPPRDPRSAWPCYRHDPARSGASATQIADGLEELWRAPVGGRPTAPTVADGLVFVGSKDAVRLVALEAATGKPRWTFTPGGPVDTPPTLDNGAAFFGCRDGWIYCLRADDGALAWRYRVAPEERRIVAFNRVESPVPVYGSVVVVNGAVCCSAGYTSELDGGIQVCVLDGRTGQPRWQVALPRQKLRRGERLDKWTLPRRGALGDILRSDGRFLYMRDWRFDLKTGATKQSSRWIIGVTASHKTGFLDATMKRPWTHRGVGGQMLVSNKSTTCGFTALSGKGYYTAPGKGQYRLFGRHFDASGRPDKTRPGWAIERAPVAIEAMALAGGTLFVAGPPDAIAAEGGLLWAISLADGKKLVEVRLDAAPVFDGLAAADGRLYVATRDGTLRCFGGKESNK